MLDTLESFLKASVTPESMAEFIKADALFNELEIDYIDDDYQGILFRDLPAPDTVDELYRYTVGALDNILQQHGVDVIEDITSITERCDLIKGILLIADYENQSEILTIAQMDLDTEERFSELLALVLPYTADQILVHLESVSSAFVRKVIELARTGRELDEVDELDRAQSIRQMHELRDFSRFIKEQLPDELDIVVAVRDNNVPVNLNFITYAKLIGRDFESMQERVAAANLLGMALISYDGCDAPLAIIQKNIEQFISDMNKVTRVAGFAARELLMQFTAWKSNRQGADV